MTRVWDYSKDEASRIIILAERLGLLISSPVHGCLGGKFLGSFTHGCVSQELRTQMLSQLGLSSDLAQAFIN